MVLLAKPYGDFMIRDLFTGEETIPHYNIDFRDEPLADETDTAQLALPL